ncbi:MAG: hypothetical protein AAGA81_08040 [Acidobacteriota bacterium]
MRTARLAALVLGFLLLAPARAEETFVFEKLNRAYSEFVQELAPIQVGGANVLLSSPQHSITLIRNQSVLHPAPEGGFLATVDLRLGGYGKLNAQVEMGSVATQLDDELALPAQSLVLRGRVDITEAAEGFWIRVLELPESVKVRIESRLAGKLFNLCRPMALVLVSLDCDLLEESLTNIEVPLPEPGETYLLPREELTDSEAKRLSAFIGG